MNTGRALTLFLLFVSSLFAEPQQDNTAQKFVGAWRLVSVEGTDATFHFAYDHPTGMIVYDRSGWMSVQIDIKGARKPFVNGPAGGTGEEKVAAFDNYIAYYGTYTLDLKAQLRQIGAASIMSDGSSFKATIAYSLSPARTGKEE